MDAQGKPKEGKFSLYIPHDKSRKQPKPFEAMAISKLAVCLQCQRQYPGAPLADIAHPPCRGGRTEERAETHTQRSASSGASGSGKVDRGWTPAMRMDLDDWDD